jgi:hypothetical protein
MQPLRTFNVLLQGLNVFDSEAGCRRMNRGAVCILEERGCSTKINNIRCHLYSPSCLLPTFCYKKPASQQLKTEKD